jgi:hypothetical protein
MMMQKIVVGAVAVLAQQAGAFTPLKVPTARSQVRHVGRLQLGDPAGPSHAETIPHSCLSNDVLICLAQTALGMMEPASLSPMVESISNSLVANAAALPIVRVRICACRRAASSCE